MRDLGIKIDLYLGCGIDIYRKIDTDRVKDSHYME